MYGAQEENHLIDILLATHNSEKYLGEQIASIQRQTNAGWNLIISDDNSTDSTLDIIASFIQSDSRIRLLEHEQSFGGACPNFMFLLRNSTSAYSMFCDHDDVWLERKVEITLNKMQDLESQYSSQTPLMVFTDMEVVDENLSTLHRSFEKQMNIDPNRTRMMQVLAAPVAAGCTMMINQALRKKALITPPGTPMVMHDWWISLIAAAFGHIGHVDSPTSLYRQHASNTFGSLSFSTIGTIKSSRTAYTSILKKISHAKAFYSVYGDMLDSANKKRLEAVIDVYDAPRWKRIPLMIKGGAWKRGAIRKLGEGVLLLGMDMEEYPLDHA